jgi:hypothetical protein
MLRGSRARRSRFGARIVRLLALSLAAGSALPGCFTQITVREIDDATWFARESPNALQTGKPSERTTQFLRREGLLADVYRDCEPVLRRIHGMLIASQERIFALHLSELCFLASSNRGNEQEDRVRYLLSAVEYAYAYLFDDDLVPAIDPYDPGFRWACDFYNRSLAEVVRLERDRRPLAHGPATMPVLEGAVELERGASDYDWAPSTRACSSPSTTT